MLVAGEEPLYVLRRMVRFASEDIGLADPQALVSASPPRTPMTSSVRPRANWRSCRPASIAPPRPNRTPPTRRRRRHGKAPRETGSLMPPANILNAPTKLMKDIGYGAGYAYDHDRGWLFRRQLLA
jgi:putative ATPase